MENKCYKMYPLKKTLEKISQRKDIAENDAPTSAKQPRSARRSSVTPRDKQTAQCKMHDQRCVIFGFVKHLGTSTKYRISEMNRAKKFLEDSVFFLGEMYTRTYDLHNIN